MRRSRRTRQPASEPTSDDAGPEPPFDFGQLTPEAVTWAYRLLLDREPENDQAVDNHLSLESTRQLRHIFMRGAEFRGGNEIHYAPVLRGDSPPLDIDDVREPERMAELYEHIRQSWHGLGETQPHFSVLTSPDYTPEKIDDRVDEFYESGATMVDNLFGVLARIGVDTSGLRTCLELGCGVGRITVWLAQRFDEVVGCDISAAHLEIAAEAASQRGCDNVTLRHLGSLDDLAALPSVDLVYTVIVLQHNPPPVIRVLIGALLDALNPGGIAFFQVPTYIHGYHFRLDDYLAEDLGSGEIEMHPLPQRDVFEVIRERGCVVIEVIDDDETGNREQVVSNTFVVQKPA